MSTAPVAIFDSGVGGLSVAREIHTLLPAEQLLYYADTAYVPYGGRSTEEIQARSLAVAGELIRRGAKVVVAACNTATGAALELLRERFHVPIVGLEPAVKPAAQRTRRGKIGVLATSSTLRSPRFARLLENYASGVEVIAVPGTGLVELVETGDTRDERAVEVLAPLLEPMRQAGVDALVLGCTHYPFLRDTIGELLGEGVEIIDSGRAVARQVQRVLAEAGALAEGFTGSIHVLTSGDPALVRDTVDRLWNAPVTVEHAAV